MTSQSTLCEVDGMQRTEAERLFLKNRKLVHHALWSRYPTFAGDEDMQQEALVGLWKACLTYDKNKSKFSTYAISCILNQVRLAMRALAKQPETVSLSTVVGEDDSCTLEEILEDPYPRTSPDCIALKMYIEGLEERDRQVVQYALEGLTQKQIAKHLGMSQVWVSRTLKRLRQEYLEQEDQEWA